MNIEGGHLRALTLDRLQVIHQRVTAAVEERRKTDPASVDPLRGLYITDDHAATIASGEGRIEPPLGALDPEFSAWAAWVGIADQEVDMLLVAAAPDIDRRYEQLYGYLHDDITMRRATTGLALRLTGHDTTEPTARSLLTADAPLVALGLVEIQQGDRPFLTRTLHVADRVVAGLLGDDRPAAAVCVESRSELDNEWVRQLSLASLGDLDLIHIVDHADRTAVELAAAALVSTTGEVVVVRVDEGYPDWQAILADGIREAALRSCGLIVDSLDSLLKADTRFVDRLAMLPRTVVLVGRRPWNPEWSPTVPLVLQAPPLERSEREGIWSRALGASRINELEHETAAFRLGPERIRRAAASAIRVAEYRGAPLSAEDLRLGARQQNASGLGRLARRIEPSATWDDLILDPEPLDAVREVARRIRHRSVVLDDWGLRRGGDRGEGVTALFAGPSGTGKTLAAEVIAHELGVDLHTVDLATVVDKYIGETEKNLDRIFEQAEQVNTVLFFDEADALFGKRSEVKDARDRYANVEVAYLLQRMERFDGLVVLATNLRLNIDDAFSRRLDVTVDFPKPEPDERKRLWAHLMGTALPVDESVDLAFLAKSFDLAGGSIRNAVVTAAYLAVEDGRPVGMPDLVRAVALEYQKLGRLRIESEFGDWLALATASPPG